MLNLAFVSKKSLLCHTIHYISLRCKNTIINYYCYYDYYCYHCLFLFSSYYYYLKTTNYFIHPKCIEYCVVAKFPRKLFDKTVAKNYHLVQCDNCHLWVHIKCNKINLQTYKFLQKSSLAWYCIKCFEDIISFLTTSNKNLDETNVVNK